MAKTSVLTLCFIKSFGTHVLQLCELMINTCLIHLSINSNNTLKYASIWNVCL